MENTKFQNSNLPTVILVIGTRPEAVKCSPLISVLKSDHFKTKLDLVVLSTGQHREILKETLKSFNQSIDIDLNLMTANQDLSRFFQLAFTKTTDQFKKIKNIKLVVVQGDTTTALAASLAAAYLHIPVAHVEAGLRSYDMENPFPEEENRHIIDSISTLLFAPTAFAKKALQKESICDSNIFVTGNTGIDAFLLFQSKKKTLVSPILTELNNLKKNSKLKKIIILVTMHRRENYKNVESMCSAIKNIGTRYLDDVVVILPVHPNPNFRHKIKNFLKDLSNILLVEPIAYDSFPQILNASDIVLTDSGGIQEEASTLGKPIILMRDTTERPEGIYHGTIQLIGSDSAKIELAVQKLIEKISTTGLSHLKRDIFGDGKASQRIAGIIEQFLYKKLPLQNPQCSTKARQNLIAKEVFEKFSNSTKYELSKEDEEKNFLFDNNFKKNFQPYEIRKSQLKSETVPQKRLTMEEIFSLPSEYHISKKDEEQFSVTSVVSLYRRKGLAKRWINSLLKQTHSPKIIWLVYFASPISDDLDQEIGAIRKELNESGVKIPIYTNRGDMQLKYFGRFQLALQTKTNFVVVFDDDSIPQSRFIEACLHTINTQSYRGILGTKGTPFEENAFFGPISQSDTIVEVDVVGGSWFMRNEWVKLMFRDKMFSWETGEDWHLCVSARKYANVRCFVMPVNKADKATNGFSDDYLQVSHSGDTNGFVQNQRRFIRMQQNTRGDRHMNSYQNNEKNLLVFIEDKRDAINLILLLDKLIDKSIQIVLAVHNNDELGIKESDLKRVKVVKDFMIGRDYNSNVTLLSRSAESFYHFEMIVQQTQSTVLVVVGSSGNAATVGVVTAARLLQFPIINFSLSDQVKNIFINQIIKDLSSINLDSSDGFNLEGKTIKNFQDFLKAIY
ncbi:UDP-N-acetylglucosamine 2-epimerase [Brachionus plicatilis]|uniref:UDP-N-acetylglucosamine 2-epimerase (non-hydrolyzing) n=1 Tax=Brachionus plicatilis TaxID=10195 RepID=A0A3M7S1E3_BRAPC|nr:UDP-N-acetylglucosamine 2-epimerase [Brachionus plicatilis]